MLRDSYRILLKVSYNAVKDRVINLLLYNIPVLHLFTVTNMIIEFFSQTHGSPFEVLVDGSTEPLNYFSSE